ncbi:MAG: DnaJ domain-containing protein [Deltaproteobacteria bacterium]|nr:DnaJ domain-containing protein [Deltaproteobacteria bacterium]
MSGIDYYQVLGLQPGATLDEVKRRYRQLARQFHPDLNKDEQSPEMFSRITEAYNVLADPEAKRRYDEAFSFDDPWEAKIHAYKRAEKLRPKSKGSSSTQSKSEKKERKPEGKSSSTTTRPEEPAAFEGPSGVRFSGKKLAEEVDDSFLGKVTQTFRRVQRSTEEILGKSSGSHAREPISESYGTREPEFRFTLDALESIRGSSREISIEGASGPRLIRVKTPPGIHQGAVLKVNCPPKDDEPGRMLHVRVYIEPHELVEREGFDIIVSVPITIAEAVSGAEIEVPTLEGPLKINLPPGWDPQKRLRIKGRGVKDEVSGESGNLFVKTIVVLPDEPSKALTEAAEKIEFLYRGNVRGKIPRSLL